MNRKLYNKVIPALIIAVAGITFHSCKYDKVETEPCNGLTPDVVSFKVNVQPIFNAYCNDAGCHSGNNPSGNLNLEESQSYDQLSQQGSGYINIVNPTHSILYTQMNSSSQIMPPTGKIDQCKIDLILKWIQQGALNN